MKDYFAIRPKCAMCKETGLTLITVCEVERMIRCSCELGITAENKKLNLPRWDWKLFSDYPARPLPLEWFIPDREHTFADRLENYRKRVNESRDFWSSRFVRGVI